MKLFDRVLNPREIRRRLAPHQPLMVAITGHDSDEARRKSKEVGFDAHLVKPVDYTTLMKLLDDFFARKQRLNPPQP